MHACTCGCGSGYIVTAGPNRLLQREAECHACAHANAHIPIAVQGWLAGVNRGYRAGSGRGRKRERKTEEEKDSEIIGAPVCKGKDSSAHTQTHTHTHIQTCLCVWFHSKSWLQKTYRTLAKQLAATNSAGSFCTHTDTCRPRHWHACLDVVCCVWKTGKVV